MERKKKTLLLYKGSYTVNFIDEDEYNEFLKERKKYFLSATIMLLSFFITILFFLISLEMSKFGIWCLIVVIIFAISIEIERFMKKRYDDYKFDLIIRDIKRSNKRIVFANASTGRITYLKEGVNFSLYVFKGKNAKGA